jgi:hypothetical protein
MWVATTNFPTAASHPFYTRLNQRLAAHYFDDFVEGQPEEGVTVRDRSAVCYSALRQDSQDIRRGRDNRKCCVVTGIVEILGDTYIILQGSLLQTVFAPHMVSVPC